MSLPLSTAFMESHRFWVIMFSFSLILCIFWGASLVAQKVKASAYNVGDRVQSLGQEDPLEKEMAAHSITLAWKIQWT